MKKAFPAAAFVSVLLFLAVAGSQLVNLGKANPYQFRLMEEVPPDADTEPPTIAVLSPKNNTAYASHNLVLSLNVSVKYSGSAKALFFWKIYYEADWQSGSTVVYEFIPETGRSTISEFNSTIYLKGIPNGNHTLVVYAIEGGRYEEPEPGSAGFVTLYFPFKITGSSSVSFTIDTTAPEVTVLSPQNKIYDTADVQLNFTANESVSRVSYVLDGQENVTISGNMTLPKLSNGAHSVTVYAWDAAGNVGAAEAVYFTVDVPEPFPVVPVVAASGAAITVATACVFYYRKKRSH